MSGAGQAALRPASVEDAPALTAFLSGLGLAMPDGPDAVIGHWRALWIDNPALARHAPGVALGWVLEDGGAIRGFFGNIPQLAHIGDAEILVSSARAWAVEKSYRGETPRLCEEFFLQTGIDLVLISSASAPAGKRCLDFGGARMPQPGYGDILYWIVDAPGFLRAAFRKKGRAAATAWWLGLAASVPLDFTMRLSGRRPYGRLDGVTPVPISGVDADFDELWRAKRRELPETLFACRDATTLKWYFGLGAGAAETRFLRLDRDGKLRGYAVLVREDAPAIGLKRIKIADLVLLEDDPKLLAALLAGAYEYALAKGCHVVELVGLPTGLRAQTLRHKPYSRPMPTFPFFHKALQPDLEVRLADPNAWYVTAFDGDTALL